MKILDYILKNLISLKIKTAKELAAVKNEAARKFKSKMPVSNMALIQRYLKLLVNGKMEKNETLLKLLKKREIRTLSGVAVVSVLTKPWSCPGNCIFCPTEKGMPKSYLSNEPAAARAKLLKFDPYIQTKRRIEALRDEGHKTDKIELIVIGGTWSAYPKKYQEWFIKKCFDAANGKASKNLEQAKKWNESSTNRIVGISLETRPDFINEKEIKIMRMFGATKVEIGVQSIYDDILKMNNRLHNVKDIINTTKLLKNAGFKICYHMMPGLYGSSVKKDIAMFKEIFTNSDFQPDMLKIYPCVVLKGTKLYDLWENKKYKPLADKQLIEIISEIKKSIPPYVRINRVIRDIPSQSISAGGKISNLRQMLAEKSKKENWNCQCIRCREIRGNFNAKEKPVLKRIDYDASDGKEIFLSFIDGSPTSINNLYSFLRLRLSFNSEDHYIPALKNSAIIRELHTYGEMVEIDLKNKNVAQHRGLGKKLLKEAEKIAKKEFGTCPHTKRENSSASHNKIDNKSDIDNRNSQSCPRCGVGVKKIAVISGVGVRGYYRKLGYRLEDEYMVKNLTD